jgi:hypothetical protein
MRDAVGKIFTSSPSTRTAWAAGYFSGGMRVSRGSFR